MPRSETTTGLLYATICYGSWGFVPIYWKLFGTLPVTEILAHRMVWSLAFVLGILAVQRRFQELREALRLSKQLLVLLATATLLTCTWSLYVYSVLSDQVIETSIGFYINPLVSVMFGFFFLKERLNRWQTLAIALACAGVANLVWDFGTLPWIALGLAFSFGFYGLLRKIAPVAPLVGLTVETLLLTPVALLAIGYWTWEGTSHFGEGWQLDLLYLGSGIVTALPLLWFANAAKRLRLATVGLFQYLAPSIQLVLAIHLYREPFTTTHLITFGCIWAALFLYSGKSLLENRRLRTADA